MRYERWQSSHILWAPRPELLRNMVKGNLAASRRGQCVTNAGLIANILRAPSTSSAQKYGKGKFSGESPQPMRYERWRSSHILWAPRPELLKNMVKGNLAASRRINPGARRRCGRGIPAGRRKRLPCCTFPRTSVPCRWAGWCQRRTHSRRGRPCPPEDTPYIYPPWP